MKIGVIWKATVNANEVVNQCHTWKFTINLVMSLFPKNCEEGLSLYNSHPNEEKKDKKQSPFHLSLIQKENNIEGIEKNRKHKWNVCSWVLNL